VADVNYMSRAHVYASNAVDMIVRHGPCCGVRIESSPQAHIRAAAHISQHIRTWVEQNIIVRLMQTSTKIVPHAPHYAKKCMNASPSLLEPWPQMTMSYMKRRIGRRIVAKIIGSGHQETPRYGYGTETEQNAKMPAQPPFLRR
jgi:hypothetical protein